MVVDLQWHKTLLFSEYMDMVCQLSVHTQTLTYVCMRDTQQLEKPEQPIKLTAIWSVVTSTSYLTCDLKIAH